jgi:uncharacterized protein (TIGR00255 family)
MPNSMTGFARVSEKTEWGEVSCEIRSVNHRYLEPLIRLPDQLRPIEMDIRERLRQQLQRGKIDISFQFLGEQQSAQSLSINIALLQALSTALMDVSRIHPQAAPADPVSLLQWPGVVEQVTLDDIVIQQVAIRLADEALRALIDHRKREGAILRTHIEERLQQIAELVLNVRKHMPLILESQRNRLRLRLAEFKTELDENRLEQEMVLLANKADVAEELDRLATHLQEVGHILQQPGAVGRRLDFMMQELNREANTLSSKSLTSETTQAAVSIKVLIEQMREQIQNIE